MKKTTLIRFAQSFIVIPVLTLSGTPMVNTVGPVSQAVINIANTTPSFVSPQSNIKLSDLLAPKEAVDPELEAQKERAEKAQSIDAYFKARNMPLAGVGMTMVLEAEKNDIDWRLLPAIAVRESTGGKFACKKATYNSFGWGSCKINFESNEKAIETVARNLGGNNPNTDHHYAGKNTKQILQKYNPPSIVPRYAEQVMAIMDQIGPEEINSEALAVNI